MIDSRKILSLYLYRMEAKIYKKYSDMRMEILDNLNLQKKYVELVEKFRSDINDLYKSQFNDKLESEVDKSELQLIRNNSYVIEFEIIENTEFCSQEIVEINNKEAKEIAELTDFINEVKALLSVCETKDEIFDVLRSYNIINRNGCLQFE